MKTDGNILLRRLCVVLAAMMLMAGAAAQEVPVKMVRLQMPDSVRKRLPIATSILSPQRLTKVEQREMVKEHFTFGALLDGDTVPLYYLREVTVYSSGMLLTSKEISKNAKLIRNVRLMLPFAREAKRRLDALEVEIANLPKKQRKAAIKRAEQQIKDDYKDQLSKYTFSQGLVLIKLIDRETNRTAYSLVGDLRGSFRAGLYQAFARLFGYNLKTKFDPAHDKKDELMDRIVRSIERGQL